MSYFFASSWLENLFCCKNENEVSTENNTDQEEEREPFTRQENTNQENGEISPPPPGQSKNGSHQNKVITEQPRNDSKTENKILFCCAGVCVVSVTLY